MQSVALSGGSFQVVNCVPVRSIQTTSRVTSVGCLEAGDGGCPMTASFVRGVFSRAVSRSDYHEKTIHDGEVLERQFKVGVHAFLREPWAPSESKHFALYTIVVYSVG